jgi:hypothetical protein
MMDEEIRTIPLSLESTVNGIKVSIPWAQRQANGAVILRVHMQSPRHSAGELLLNDTDLVAIDAEERPLRTQVRRFWGYSALADVTSAHLQTARFDVGFRLDLLATGGQCGLSIAIIRTFRPGEGPKVAGGPWVFKLRVADEAEVAALARLEAARLEAAQREQAQREQAQREQVQREQAQREQVQREQAQREQAQREAAERDAAQREAARFARARAEAERPDPLRIDRPQQPFEMRREQSEGFVRPDRSDVDEYAGGPGRSRRPARFGRPDRGGRDELRRDTPEFTQPASEQQAVAETAAARFLPVPSEPFAQRPSQPPADMTRQGAQPRENAEARAPQFPSAAAPRTAPPRVRAPRSSSSSTNRMIEAAVLGPAETALEEIGERPRPSPETIPVALERQSESSQESGAEKPAARVRAARPAVRRTPRTSKSADDAEGSAGEATPAE